MQPLDFAAGSIADAAVGTLEATTWTDKTGAERKGWRLLAHEVLGVHQARKRRDAGEGASQ